MSSIDQRSPLMVLEDALCKARVLRGIALLEEKHGPDWPSKVDLDELDLSSSRSCVLGQVYHNARVSSKQAQQFADSPRGCNVVPDDPASYFSSRDVDGYERGLAILDGPLLDQYGPQEHGFDAGWLPIEQLEEMTDERLAAEGVTREMVKEAAQELRFQNRRGTVSVSHPRLDTHWTEQIKARQ